MILEKSDEVRVANVMPPFLHLGGMMSAVGRAILHCHHQFPHGFFDAFEEIVTKCDSFIGGNVVYMRGEEERL